MKYEHYGQYADFCLGDIRPPTEDGRFIRSQRINEAMDVARVLLSQIGK